MAKMDDGKRAGLEDLVGDLTAYFKREELVVSLTAPTSMACLLPGPERQFKTLAMAGNEEFFVDGFRVGARDLLVEFRPFEVATYVRAELPAHKATLAFPPFLEACAKALDMRSAFEAVQDLESAEARWRAFEVDVLRARESSRGSRIREASRATAGSNPRFGRF